jgi:predicted O-methyltransferase YrrM
VTFVEEWFPVQSQRALSRRAKQTGHLSGRVIEIGCWEGRSTCALAHAAWPTTVHAVDTWQGSPGEISQELARDRDVLATFIANVTDLTRGNVKVHQQDWRDYYETDRSPVRFLHIDAEHSYREVFDTISSFLPLMQRGGIICGDDAHDPNVVAAVGDLLPAYMVEATLWVWENNGD